MKRKNKFDLFLIFLGVMIIVESLYFLGVFYSFHQAAKEFGMKTTPFIIFTYAFVAFKFSVGVMAIMRGRVKKERKRL